MRKAIGNGDSTLAFRDPWLSYRSTFQVVSFNPSNECMRVADFISHYGC